MSSINGAKGMDSVVSMLNSKAKSASVQLSQQMSADKSKVAAIKASKKSDDIKTANTQPLRELKPENLFNQLSVDVHSTIDRVDGAYKDVQLVERYEDLLKDDSYSDSMKTQFKNSIDYYKQRVITQVKKTTELQGNMFGAVWGDFASKTSLPNGDSSGDLASAIKSDNLGLSNISMDMSSKELYSILDNAMAKLNPAGAKISRDAKDALDATVTDLFPHLSAKGKLSTYELEKYDAMNQHMINPRDWMTVIDSFEVDKEKGPMLNINDLMSGKISRDDLDRIIKNTHDAHKERQSQMPPKENVSLTYKEYKDDVDGANSFLGVAVTDSRFNAKA